MVWNAAKYVKNCSFVPALATNVVGWLNPVKGEKILDIGCGDGILTKKLQDDHGVDIYGIDSSPSMVEKAKERGLKNIYLLDAQDMTLSLPNITEMKGFDAVFSNAAIHWMNRNPAGVIQGARAVLKNNNNNNNNNDNGNGKGRFVGEFGGQGNVAAIVSVINCVLNSHGYNTTSNGVNPFYFPNEKEYSQLLSENGFTVKRCELIHRQTPLGPAGIAGWLDTFALPFFSQVKTTSEVQIMKEEIIAALKFSLYKEKEKEWFADYVRLRFETVVKEEL